MQVKEIELKKKCQARKWVYNNFTAYLLESNRTSCNVAYMLGMSTSTTNYWLHNELSGLANAFFLLVRKLKLMKNIDLLDL